MNALVTGTPLRCAIYARFSSEMQTPRSVADQERECRAFAAQKGWHVVLVHADEAVRAGAAASRTGYTALIEQARQKKFDVLLVEEVSRFSREFMGGLTELGQLQKYGVTLADTKSGVVDLKSAIGQLQITFNLVTSEQETQRLGERSKRGLKGKTLERYSSGGQPPFGYKRVAVYSATRTDVDGRPLREGVRFEPEQNEAPIVRRIFTLYADGVAKHAIARLLNEEGVPTRRAGGQVRGKKNSGTWAASSIKAILENRIYTGERVWNQTSRTGEKLSGTGKKKQLKNAPDQWVIVKDFATPLLEPELWEATQKRLADDLAEFNLNHNANGKRQYLLSGFVRCASCGNGFTIGAHQGNPRVPHYRCSFRTTRGTSVCNNRITVSQPALEERIKRTLDVVAKDPTQLEELVAQHNQRISSANDTQLAIVRTMESKRAALQEQQGRLIEAVRMGGRAAALLVTELDTCAEELEQLGQQLEKAQSLVQPVLQPQSPPLWEYIGGDASLFSGDFNADRLVVEQALKAILIYEDGSVGVQFRAESFFAPVQQVHLQASESPLEAVELAERRSAVLDQVQTSPVSLWTEPWGQNQPPVDLEQDHEGNLRAVVPQSGASQQKRLTGSALRPARQIALASPAGFEPALQP